MSYSDDMIKAIFVKYDKNGDGYISKEELNEVVRELSFSSSEKEVDEFFAIADTNKDNKLGFDEFSHYVHFQNSELKKVNDVLHLTASALTTIKQLDAVKFPNLGDKSEHHFVVRDSSLNSAEGLASKLQILFSLGKENKNEDLLKTIDGKLGKEHFLAFKFHVKDKASVLEKFPELWSATKEFLRELGSEAAEFLDKTDVDFIEGADGVFMAFKPKPDTLINNFLNAFNNSTNNLGNLEVAKSLTIASDFDFTNFEDVTFEQLSANRFFIEGCVNSTNQVNALFIPEVRKILSSVNLHKNFAQVSAFISLFCLKSVKSEVIIDTELRAKIFNTLDVKDKDQKINTANLESFQKEWEENPTKELLESMEFIKEAINTLHAANIEGFTLFIQTDNARVGIHIKANLHKLINRFYPLN